MKNKTVIIYDTESTGLLKPQANDLSLQPYITEIYCLKVEQDSDGNCTIIDEFESYCKPPIPIPAEVTKINGIDDATLVDAPSFAEIAKPLGEFFTGVDRMVAHNLSYDRSMVANELMRSGKVLNFPWPVDHVCTIEKTIHIEQRRMNLTRLHEHLFGKGFADAHRARNDVEALYSCYRKLVETGVIK